MKNYVCAMLLAAAALSLTACAGGGSGYSPTHKPPVERTASPRPLVAVPDIVGMDVAAAQQAVELIGLELSGANSPVDAADVVDSQNPAAGEELREGESVYITWAAPAPTSTPTPESARLAADDPARVGLEAQFGLIFTDDSFKGMRDQYCTMTDKALADIGDYASDQVRDVTPAKFVLWVAEKCGR